MQMWLRRANAVCATIAVCQFKTNCVFLDHEHPIVLQRFLSRIDLIYVHTIKNIYKLRFGTESQITGNKILNCHDCRLGDDSWL